MPKRTEPSRDTSPDRVRLTDSTNLLDRPGSMKARRAIAMSGFNDLEPGMFVSINSRRAASVPPVHHRGHRLKGPTR